MGGAINPRIPQLDEEATAYTFGLGVEMAAFSASWQRAEGSTMAFVQDSGNGPALALVGRVTGATARIGVKADFRSGAGRIRYMPCAPHRAKLLD